MVKHVKRLVEVCIMYGPFCGEFRHVTPEEVVELNDKFDIKNVKILKQDLAYLKQQLASDKDVIKKEL